MTEEEWLAGTDSLGLLNSLRNDRRGPRKLRLLVSACALQNQWFMNLPGAGRLVHIEDRWRHGLATIRDMENAFNRLRIPARSDAAGAMRLGFLTDDPFQAAVYTLAWATNDESESEKWCADVIRCLFGNPFRPVTFDPRWRTSDVVGLARAIYDDKAFERMPILADALMDAGCEEEQIIAHCRGDGPHVRGCWVVDLVLGKE